MHIYLLSLPVCIDPPFPVVVTAAKLQHELLQELLALALSVAALKLNHDIPQEIIFSTLFCYFISFVC